MPVFKDHSFRFGASGASDAPVYEIENSIRFNRTSTTADHYMHRTPGGAGNRKKWTWSCWFKLGLCNNMIAASNLYYAFLSVDHATNDSNRGTIQINNDSGISDEMNIALYGHSTKYMVAKQKVNDPHAWYHLVVVWDTDNSNGGDRTRMWINGVRVHEFLDYNVPDAAEEIGINLAQEHRLGAIKNISNSAAQYGFDGYMAEIFFLDGYAYDASYFGQFDNNGIWIPSDYNTDTGDYGSNGFYLKGDNAGTLGNSHVNSNHFTLVGITNHDQMIDTPNNNFNVMSPINSNPTVNLSDGNLYSTSSSFSSSGGTILIPSTGKWYAEFKAVDKYQHHEYPMVGVFNPDTKDLNTTAWNPGNTTGDLDIGFGMDTRRYEDGTNTSSYHDALNDGDIAAIAIDMDNKKIWYGHNGSGSFAWQVSGNPNTGANPANTKDFNDRLIFGNSHYSGSQCHWNFGQDGTFGGTETAGGNTDANGIGNFFYTVPTGYMALCTRNIFTS